MFPNSPVVVENLVIASVNQHIILMFGEMLKTVEIIEDITLSHVLPEESSFIPKHSEMKKI